MKKLFAVLIAIAMIASLASAQLKQSALGIQTGITGTGGSFGGVYNLSNNLRLDVVVGFSSISPTGGSSTSEFTIGAGVDYFMNVSESVTPFVGGLFQFTSQSSGGASATGIDVIAKAGLAYWFSSRFSVQGYLQLGFGSSGPSGATTSTFGTSTGTALTLYL